MNALARLSILCLLGAVCAFFSLSAATAKQKSTELTGVININQATPKQLQLLPNIGPSKAKAIVQHREKTPYKNPKDLIKVKGIGKKSFEKIRAYIVVSGQTTLQKTAKARSKSNR